MNEAWTHPGAAFWKTRVHSASDLVYQRVEPPIACLGE